MSVLHVIDTLDGGSGRQLELLSPALGSTGTRIEVCCLGPATRQVETLRRTGVVVHVLGWTRWFDVGALWALRRLLRAGDYDQIHIWRLPALRVVAALAADQLHRATVSAIMPESRRLRWWDRRALDRVRLIAAASDGERERWLALGVAPARCHMVPSAVAASGTADAGSFADYPRRIVCAGRLERGRGFREAIWAVDVLRYVFADIHLLVAGSGPSRADLQAMIDRLQIANAHLLGDAVEPGAVLATADVCWVPSRDNRGRQAALDAMAAGKAVIASDVPCLREVIRDGATGCLVPPGEPVALARRTRALLHDRDQAAQLGAAARAEVLERFDVQQVAARWRALYNERAA